MKTLFNGVIDVEYSQFYIKTKDHNDNSVVEACFEGQANGLFGAAYSNWYHVSAGIQDGKIDLAIKLYQSEPKVNSSYEDIVEVSITRGKDNLLLTTWDGDSYKLDFPEGDYRVRYSLIGMDKDHNDNGEADDLDDDDEYWNSPLKGQKHLIEIWPGELRKDAILKETSKNAKAWHDSFGRSGK